MKKPAVAGFFISAIDALPIERAAANAKPGTEDFNGPFSARTRQFAPLATKWLEFWQGTTPACMCRVLTQTAGKPASARALNSHCDSGPASSPIREAVGRVPQNLQKR
jgi:hypothetical protein